MGKPISGQEHVPELDSIRGLAALSVVIYHAFPAYFTILWAAVDCFFVLSGYLITSILLRHLGSPRLLPAFYFRRLLRIWPVYYLTLAAVLTANGFSSHGFNSQGWVARLVFLQNIQGNWGKQPGDFVNTFAPSWSVAVEEQFYLLWPILLICLGRRAVAPAAACMIAAAILVRWLDFPNGTLLCRCDGLALGCTLAVLLQCRSAWIFALLAVAGLSSLLVVSCYLTWYPGTASAYQT